MSDKIKIFASEDLDFECKDLKFIDCFSADERQAIISQYSHDPICLAASSKIYQPDVKASNKSKVTINGAECESVDYNKGIATTKR